MNTDEVDFYAKTNPKTKKFYIGCYPSNKIPRLKNHKKASAFIINTCEASRSDSFCHWVAIFLTTDHIQGLELVPKFSVPVPQFQN